jgi:prepilin-type N-terminal cleavage/methylation domain-containing protein
MTNDDCCRGVCIKRLTNGFGARRGERRYTGFTLIEMIVVTTVIVILTGLVLSTVGYVQKKAARARAETEIAAISAACESYKADNGVYPSNCPTTSQLNSTNTGNPSNYEAACRYVYGEVTGDRNFDGTTDSGAKSYMTLKPQSMLRADMSQPPSASNPVTAIRDPFGNSYGYSTAYANYLDYQNGVSTCAPPTASPGYNPTFDLWTTCGETAPKAGETFQQYQLRWVKSW